MKKIILILFLIFETISASVKYDESIIKSQTYIDDFTDYKLYLITDSLIPYRYSNKILSNDPRFIKNGFLNLDEYLISRINNNSYLFNGIDYFTMTEYNNDIYIINDNVNGYQLQSKTISSNIKPTYYIKDHIEVTGTGTFNDPWKFIKPNFKIELKLTKVKINNSYYINETINTNVKSYQLVPDVNTIRDGNIICDGLFDDYNLTNTELKFIGIRSDISCTLKYKDDSVRIDYSGEIVDYIIPLDGHYILQACGAQGENQGTEGFGGKGGCIIGKVYLEKDDILKVNVGGQNGYNGGGKKSDANSGGGATTIAFNNINLLTAAGGGGAGKNNSAEYIGGTGGSGSGSGGKAPHSSGEAGVAGTNGAGGSSSTTYTMSVKGSCLEYETTITQSYCCVKASNDGGIGGAGDTICRGIGYGPPSNCAGSYWIEEDEEERCSKYSYTYTNYYGLPGEGGTSSVNSSVVQISKTDGQNEGNGYVVIKYDSE